MLVEVKYRNPLPMKISCATCEGIKSDCPFAEHLKRLTDLDCCNKYSPNITYSTFETDSEEFYIEVLELIKKYGGILL